MSDAAVKDYRTAALEAKVKAVNRANAYAKEIAVMLHERFTPLVGQTILKVDGQFLKKVAGLVPEFQRDHSIMVYRHLSDYSLAWTVKTNESIECDRGGCLYHETTVYIGSLSDGVLKELEKHDYSDLRTDYTAEEIKAKRLAYRAAKEAAQNALSALYPFDEYDR